ncbi:MAG TPA: HAMP domain-containing sensor histidine kinase [Longimicrobium sp.]|jgi:signal transduction histidine kinase
MTVPAPGDPHLAQLRKLTEVSRALTYTTSLQQVTRLTVERGADLIDAACAVLMLPDADGVLQVRSSCGVADEDAARLHAPLTDDGVGRLQELLGVPDDRFVAVPLVVGGAVTGLLAAATRQASTSTDETLLSALADQAALALENARLGGEVREEMEDRLRASEGATDAQERALSTLAHDIRTPLGAIDGYCENLEIGVYGPVTDRQREALGRVRMSGRHLLSLLDNVMEMARLNAGVLRVGAEPVELADVAGEAVHMLLPAAQAKLVALEVGAVEEVTVTADHARVRQVLVNLVGNAVKFTPADGSVRVSTGVRSIDGRAWGEIRVTDTGPGIAPAEQAAIFEPYYRSEETAQLPGVGLGLAISQALVRQMAGELALESEPGAGSTFIARFPALPLP